MALTPSVYKKTSSDAYEVGLLVSWKNKDVAHKTATVTITPLLRRNSDYKRYQHKWDVLFSKDGVWQHTDNYNSSAAGSSKLLPNDTAATGVVSKGYLQMKKNVWYQWGSSYTMSIPNDGAKHKVGVYLRCLETVPRYCPAKDTYVEYSVNMPTYKITPPTPAGLTVTYNTADRKLTYKFSVADSSTCSYRLLYRTLYNSEGKVVKHECFQLSPKDTNKTETIPSNVTHLQWQMVHVSPSGHTASLPIITVNLDTTSKVYIKVGSVWKKAIPWVKVNGQWKKCKSVYVKVGTNRNKTKI